MQVYTLQVLSQLHFPSPPASTKTVLINTSQNLINYSHTVDLITFEYILCEYFNQKPENIKIFSDDKLYNSLIKKDEFILNLKGNNLRINKLEETNSEQKVFNRCSLQDILLVLKGKHPLVDFFKNDNVLIYLCGHGSKEFLKFHDKTYLFPGNLLNSIIELSKEVNKLFIILDTCHAESIFFNGDGESPLSIIDNICVYVTSLADEESYGVNLDEKLGVYKIDEFMFSLLISCKEITSNMKLTDFFNLVTEKTKESTHKFLKKVNWKINEFFL